MTTDFVMEDHSVYPGEYRPPKIDILQWRHEPGFPGLSGHNPPVNIIEQKDHYKIEIAAPGHTKDDFMVMAHKDRISILALKKKTAESGLSDYCLREFDYECFECEAPLPTDADSDFVSAEYKDNILTLCFFKADDSVLKSVHPIVVY